MSRWEVLARGVDVHIDASAQYPNDPLLASGFQVVDVVDTREEAARVRFYFQAKNCLVEIRPAAALRKCPGRVSNGHARSVCVGNCCSNCGGPIDENQECRCP